MTRLDRRRTLSMLARGGLLSAVPAAAAPSPASPVTPDGQVHALVIGCGRYAQLDAARQLPGAEADARLWSRLLSTVHGDRLRLEVLSSADGGQPPTHGRILQALDRLTGTVRAGDTVWLCLAGHGTQAPQRSADRYREPDGRDELFLPMDCGRWTERTGEVARAIRDDEWHRHLDGWCRIGARVVALFDTCHAAGMDRAGTAPPPTSRVRAVGLEALGGPPRHRTVAAATPVPMAVPPAADTRDFTRLTLLYACRKHERTREGWVMDAGGRRLQHGFFSWHLAQAWTALRRSGTSVGLADLQRALRERYRRDDLTGAVPQVLGADPLPDGLR